MDGREPNASNMASNHSGHPRPNTHNSYTAHESPGDMTIVYVPLMVLASFAFLVFMIRLWSDILNRQRLKFSVNYGCHSPFAYSNRAKAFLNRCLIYAPLFERRHNREFRMCRGRINMGTIPTRLETLLIVLYITLNALFCVAVIDWSRNISASLQKLTVTTGTLAVANLIPLVLTAGRNNPLIPLLRISFDTFNLFHRWLGRIVVTECVAHTAAVLVGVGFSKGWNKISEFLFHVPVFTNGLVAAIALIAILLQSLSPLRHAFYEFFLHLHIVLVTASFVALWYHLHGFMQRWVFLAALITWATDRMLRLLIVIWRNCGRSLTTATIKVLPGDVAQVDVTVIRPWKFKGGQYMYLYIPALGLWTSHPFSVAWKSTEKSASEKSSNSSVKSMLNGAGNEDNRHTVSFLIRKRGGFTKKMLKSAGLIHGRRRRVRAFAEGPFGGINSFGSYGTTILIAGGIGITHSISYLRELVDGFASGSVATRRISLMWVVRNADHLQWIQPWMADILSNPVVQGRVTFSNKSTGPDFRNPFTLDDGTYAQNVLSLSVNIYLTTYYSSSSSNAINVFAADPLPASFSSLTCDQESISNKHLLTDDLCITPIPQAHTKVFPFESVAFSHAHTQARPSLHEISRYHSTSSSSISHYPRSSSSSTLNKTIDDYYYYEHEDDENYCISPGTKDLELSTYSTNSSKTAPSPESKDWTQMSSPAAPVTINLGKPLFRQVLEREMTQQIGAMAVNVCGPGGMGDEVRKAVRDVQGRKTVEFFEECFSW